MYYTTNPTYCSQMVMPMETNLIDLLKEALKDECMDRNKYKMMMCMTKSEKIKKQIEFAFKDEGKHYKMFQQILFSLTGNMVDIPVPKIELKDKLVENIETSINGELEAVELYRKIQSMLPNMQMRDMLFEIITDEQEHATRFVYLYAMIED